MRPRLLDLFCGAGGAAMGYYRAGFDVVGLDIRPQTHYPFPFWRTDVMGLMDWRPEWVRDFEVIHASPPCQLFSRAGKLREAQGSKASTIDLLTPIRPLLEATGLPYVIENVEGAPMDGVRVCGSAFGLGVRRHRLFESNVPISGTACDHKTQGRPIGVYYRPGDDIPHGGKTARDLAEGKTAMGVDWDVTWDELKEAVPPSYTEWVGRQLIASLQAVA